MWFKKLTKEKNIITTKDFKKRTSKIPHASLMINALNHTEYFHDIAPAVSAKAPVPVSY